MRDDPRHDTHTQTYTFSIVTLVSLTLRQKNTTLFLRMIIIIGVYVISYFIYEPWMYYWQTYILETSDARYRAAVAVQLFLVVDLSLVRIVSFHSAVSYLPLDPRSLRAPIRLCECALKKWFMVRSIYLLPSPQPDRSLVVIYLYISMHGLYHWRLQYHLSQIYYILLCVILQ